jgi:hypothetical protein
MTRSLNFLTELNNYQCVCLKSCGVYHWLHKAQKSSAGNVQRAFVDGTWDPVFEVGVKLRWLEKRRCAAAEP